MKLFGYKHGGAFAPGRKKQEKPEAPSRSTPRKHRLTGIQRGAILLVASVMVLAVTVVAVYRDFVKPMAIKQPTLPDTTDSETDDQEVFTPPTTIEIETQIDEDTGE